MIQIRIQYKDSSIVSVSVSGHSGSAERGKDLICAGVSSIMTGAMNAFDIMEGNFCDFEAKSNALGIRIRKDSDRLQTMMRMLEIELATMQEAYPEYIQIAKKEV